MRGGTSCSGNKPMRLPRHGRATHGNTNVWQHLSCQTAIRMQTWTAAYTVGQGCIYTSILPFWHPPSRQPTVPYFRQVLVPLVGH